MQIPLLPKGKYPLVYVEWRDSAHPIAHWRRMTDVEPFDFICRSVGWIVAEDEVAITLAPTMADVDDDDPALNGTHPILKCAILTRKEIDVSPGIDFREYRSPW